MTPGALGILSSAPGWLSRVLPAAAADGLLFRAAVLAILAASAGLTPDAQSVVALAVVIVLGVPHGALDGEIARPVMRPRLGAAWFAVFAVPYLGLAACVLAAWRLMPELTLVVFLAGSAWHFGSEDAAGKPLEAAVRGGLPIALPVLFHPAATAQFLGVVVLHPMPAIPAWLDAAALCWAAAAAAWVARTTRPGLRTLLEPAALLALFALLPPLPAFAAYFVCCHAPRHMAALVPDRRAPRVGSMRDAIVRSVPVSLLTLLIGTALWRCYPGHAPDRLTALTIQGLAALTLPHVVLDLLTRPARRAGAMPA